MDFRTTFTIASFEHKLSRESRVLSMGSCFSTMIGNRLQERKFQILNNPFGTIFNPISLFQLLRQSLTDQKTDSLLMLEYDQRYYHYAVHSDLSDTQMDRLKRRIEQRQALTRQVLVKASHLIITFGTAWIHELSATGQIVANCHKQPQTLFGKRLLSVGEMGESFSSFYNLLRSVNPEAKIILTVSPVRHTKEGIPENQLSKSLLRVLIHQIQQKHPEVSYFPSYELMMDDLRDYRYYKDDMIHPSSLAEDYIWELFKSTYFDTSTLEDLKKIDIILNSLKHKAFHPDSKAHTQFLRRLLEKMERMAPTFDFSEEIRMIENQLNANPSKTASHDT